MKITLKYDQGVKKEEVVELEVSEKELEIMIENDYQLRLSLSSGEEIVLKRSAKEIFDELNRKEYNSWQTHNRRKVRSQQSEKAEESEADILDVIADYSQIEAFENKADYEEQCQKIRQKLKPDQAEMMIAICLDGMAVKDYAEKIGEKPNTVTKRFMRLKKFLKEIL